MDADSWRLAAAQSVDKIYHFEVVAAAVARRQCLGRRVAPALRQKLGSEVFERDPCVGIFAIALCPHPMPLALAPGTLVGALRPLQRIVGHGMGAFGQHIHPHTYQPARPRLAQKKHRIFHGVFRIGPAPRADATDALRPLFDPLQAGAQAVGGIGRAVDAHLPVVAPGGPALGCVVENRKLVDVLAFGIVHLAEETGVDHGPHQDIGPRIGHVLGHHVDGRAAQAFLHQPARFIDGNGGCDFGQDMDAALQGGDGLGDVELHGRGNDDGVRLGLVQHRLVDGVEVGDAGGLACLGQCLLVDVTQGYDLRFRIGAESSKEAAGAVHANERNLDVFGHLSSPVIGS